MVKRLEITRNKEGLNKSQFEKKLSKSTGYLNMLLKRNSNPGVDVLAKFAQEFPHYSLDWLLTGEGAMMKSEGLEEKTEGSKSDENLNLQTVRDEIRGDLKVILSGMTDNFEVINEGMIRLLQGNEKVQEFIKDMDQVKIKETAGRLEAYLRQHNA